MEDPLRGEPYRAIVDPERPERVALLDSRRFGEPVPVEAILRHPVSARGPVGGLALLHGLDRAAQAKLLDLARHRGVTR